MKVLAFVANGTEESELIGTVSLFDRAGYEVVLCSCEENLVITGSHKNKIVADYLLKDSSDEFLNSFDLVFIPGGLGGVNKFLNTNKVLEVVKNQYDNKRFVSAICAGPEVLDKAGILVNKNFTCYDGCEEEINTGNYQKAAFIVDGKVITGRSVNYVNEFALAIIETISGASKAQEVSNKILR